MTEQQQCEEQLSKAFELMWGKFPEPVMLVRRDRTVIANNDLCKAYGMVPGNKCNAVNPEQHRGCKANIALDKNEAICEESSFSGANLKTYWIPVNGVADYYIHFGIGIAERVAALQAESTQD